MSRDTWGARGRLLIAATALAWLHGGCGAGEPRSYEVRGVVRDVQRDYGQILVQHEEIPGVMEAMTMNFALRDPALFEGLEKGQGIEFTLEVSRRGYTITRIERTEAGAGADGSAPRGALPADADVAPAFALVDQDGRDVTLASLGGNAILLDFVFTRCTGPCPILSSRQVGLQRRLTTEVRARTHFVSITLDPAYDTPAALREYASARGADLSNWSFLTGAPADVEAVVASYGVGSVRAPDGDIEHLIVTFLIAPDGRIAERYVGMEDDPETILRDLMRLL